MPNQKISADPSATTLAGTELIPVIQGGANKKITIDAIISDKSIVRLVNDELHANGSALVPLTYTDLDDIDLPSAVGIQGSTVYLTQIGLHGSIWISDNAIWQLLHGRCLLDIFAENKFVVFPETAYTTCVPTTYNSGADTRLTKTGIAHGLTNGGAQNSYVYVASGTNWVVGLHKVLDVSVATDTIILDTPFDAGFGTATLNVKGTKTPYRTITIPKLRSNAALKLDLSTDAGGAVGSKAYSVELGGTAFWVPVSTTNTVFSSNNITIQNVSNTSIQTGAMRSVAVAQSGSDTVTPATGAIDTSVSTNLILYLQNSVANEKVGYTRGIIELIQ